MFSQLFSAGRLVVAVVGNCAGLLALLATAWALPALIEILLR